MNHPFVDGNKRIGLATTFIFLCVNDYILVAENSDMVAFALNLAASEPPMSWEDVALWLRRRVAHAFVDRRGEAHVHLPRRFEGGLSPAEALARVHSFREMLDDMSKLMDKALSDDG